MALFLYRSLCLPVYLGSASGLLTLFPDKTFAVPKWHVWTPVFFIGLGTSLFFVSGKEYTGLVAFALAAFTFTDTRLGSHIPFRRLGLVYIAIILAVTAIFNGYLTARPVVQYNYDYQIPFLIATIPTEDFFYGLSLLLWTTSIYEWLGKKA